MDAAYRGDAQAQYELGDLYYDGQGVEQSDAQALEWYRKSAAQGHYWGLFNVAKCYEFGRGVKQNLREALNYYERSSACGVPAGWHTDYARMYADVMRGLGLAAEEEQDSYAQYILGDKYYNGHGVVQSYTCALGWYRKSAAQGNYWGLFNVAKCYEYGHGVACDLKQAVEWYRKASAIGAPPGEEDWASIRARKITGALPINLYFWNDKPNFGDQLNRDFARYLRLNHTCVHNPAEAELACIGSVLAHIQYKGGKGVVKVFGSGFLEPPSGPEGWDCPAHFIALRGKVSRDRLEKLTGQNLQHVVLGDPGLLIQRIFPHIRRNPHSDIVGVVCHWKDANSPVLRNIHLGRYRMKVIDIMLPTETFVREVAACRVVFSSAMHALICADSLGVPNRHLVLGDVVEGGNYKFGDYYSAFDNVPHLHFDLRHEAITDEVVDRLQQRYAISQQQVNAICDRLEAALGQLVLRPSHG